MRGACWFVGRSDTLPLMRLFALDTADMDGCLWVTNVRTLGGLFIQ